MLRFSNARLKSPPSTASPSCRRPEALTCRAAPAALRARPLALAKVICWPAVDQSITGSEAACRVTPALLNDRLRLRTPLSMPSMRYPARLRPLMPPWLVIQRRGAAWLPAGNTSSLRTRAAPARSSPSPRLPGPRLALSWLPPITVWLTLTAVPSESSTGLPGRLSTNRSPCRLSTSLIVALPRPLNRRSPGTRLRA